MCDMGQTFGLVIPHLAMRSDMLFDALLKLCATSYSATLGSSMPTNSPTGNLNHLEYPIESHLEHAKMWEVKLWSVLKVAEGFLVDPPKSWDDALASNNFLHLVYTQIAENSPLRVLNERMLWLLARFSELNSCSRVDKFADSRRHLYCLTKSNHFYHQ